MCDIDKLKAMQATQLAAKENLGDLVTFYTDFHSAVKYAKANGLWEDVKHQSVDIILQCYKWRTSGTNTRGAL